MKKRILQLILAAVCIAVLTACSTQTDGWFQDDTGTYYMVNGEPATGWMLLEDKTCYFLSDGRMAAGQQEIDGETYYFDESGAMATGWQLLDGSYYYYRANGSRVTGWLSLDDTRYYLDPDGIAASGPAEVGGRMYLFDAQGKLTSGWAEVGSRRYYADENGHPLTGWQEIDGVRYLFDEDYAQQTGCVEDGGFTYYFLDSGTPAQGHVTIDGREYTFAFNGQLVVLVNPWNEIPEDYTVELSGIENSHWLADYACADLQEMLAACRSAGLNPVVCSSYRTQDYQQKLYDNRISRYMAQGYSIEDATELAGKSVAIPGTSEHQLGLALDIIDNNNWKLDESQANMPTQQWLMEHSWEYGWILRYPDEKSEITGIIYEPWHYRYVGKAVAADIHASGLCLEEYLESLTKTVG